MALPFCPHGECYNERNGEWEGCRYDWTPDERRVVWEDDDEEEEYER